MNKINNKGERNGHWESYFLDGTLWYKGNYVNGIKDGYWELYYDDDAVSHKGYYNKGEPCNLWLYHNGNKLMGKEFYL